VLLLAHRSIHGTLNPTVSGWCWLETMFSLGRARFSPGSAEDRSSLFVWFIDSMARSDLSLANCFFG
jgi:hypothetical protein